MLHDILIKKELKIGVRVWVGEGEDVRV